MSFNEVTQDEHRAENPKLSEAERVEVKNKAREAKGDLITFKGREYWSDPDCRVYVVNWRCGETVRVSGNIV